MFSNPVFYYFDSVLSQRAQKWRYFAIMLYRRERQNDRRRERNIARAAPDKQMKLKRADERDISEKIALGLPDTKSRSNETRFDERLYNQSKGLDSGGIDDETYAVYDQPWRSDAVVNQHIYRSLAIVLRYCFF